MVAGLALAGCGGSSHEHCQTGQERNADGECVAKEMMPKTPTPTPATFTNVDASGASFVTGEGGAPEEGVVSPLGTGRTASVGNVTLTCPTTAGTNGCQWRIKDGNIQSTGGVTAVVTPLPVTPQVSTAPVDGNWLSKQNIVAAVPADASDTYTAVINGVEHSMNISARRATTPDREVTRLMIADTRDPVGGDGVSDEDFLVWGTWIDPATRTQANDIPKEVWHGSIPHGEPSRTTGSPATYTGDANGFFKVGTGGWTHWDGKASLTANFIKGEVTGIIDGDNTNTVPDALTTQGISRANVSHIVLRMAKFGENLKGQVRIVGTGSVAGQNTAVAAPSSGTWEGGFFGSTIGNADPTGIAGGFNAQRNAAEAKTTGLTNTRHSEVGKFQIRGAFGAD